MNANFNEDLARSNEDSTFLDAYFDQWFEVRPATTMKWQKWGVDRLFIEKETDCQFLVEYKSDFKAHQTGCAFIEIAMDYGPDLVRVGWAQKTLAHIVAYHVVHAQQIYMINSVLMKRRLSRWRKMFPVRRCTTYPDDPNRDPFVATGSLVPLVDVHDVCFNVVSYKRLEEDEVC